MKYKEFTIQDLEECNMTDDEIKELCVEIFNDFQDLSFEYARQCRELEALKAKLESGMNYRK